MFISVTGALIGFAWTWISINIFEKHPPELLQDFAFMLAFLIMSTMGIYFIMSRDRPPLPTIPWMRGKVAIFYGLWMVIGFWAFALAALYRAIATLLGFSP